MDDSLKTAILSNLKIANEVLTQSHPNNVATRLFSMNVDALEHYLYAANELDKEMIEYLVDDCARLEKLIKRIKSSDQ